MEKYRRGVERVLKSCQPDAGVVRVGLRRYFILLVGGGTFSRGGSDRIDIAIAAAAPRDPRRSGWSRSQTPIA